LQNLLNQTQQWPNLAIKKIKSQNTNLLIHAIKQQNEKIENTVTNTTFNAWIFINFNREKSQQQCTKLIEEKNREGWREIFAYSDEFVRGMITAEAHGENWEE
jgi:predicted metal-dependent phosphoesterase TrpH